MIMCFIVIIFSIRFLMRVDLKKKTGFDIISHGYFNNFNNSSFDNSKYWKTLYVAPVSKNRDLADIKNA